METFLACVRLLMNPTVMKDYELMRCVGPGGISRGERRRDCQRRHSEVGFLGKAKGHRQIMDFYLVQAAVSHGAKLAT